MRASFFLASVAKPQPAQTLRAARGYLRTGNDHFLSFIYPGGEAQPRGQRPLAPSDQMRGWPVSRILSRGPALRRSPMDDHSSAASVTRAVKLPTRASGLKRPCGGLCCHHGLAPLAAAGLSTQGPYSALLRVGLAVPVLLPVPRWAFTPPFHLFPAKPKASLLKQQGSLFSVALSLGLPPPGVTRHPCFMESGLSSKARAPAVIQPSARD